MVELWSETPDGFWGPTRVAVAHVIAAMLTLAILSADMQHRVKDGQVLDTSAWTSILLYLLGYSTLYGWTYKGSLWVSNKALGLGESQER